MPIKYLGSKRTLLPSILRAVRALARSGTVLDLFSGTSRVGRALKAEGYRVLANDYLAFAAAAARCYVQADREDWQEDAERLVPELNRTPPSAGYFTETFCIRSRYVHPKNGERVDAIRERIDRLDLHPELEAILLVALMEAADRVDSTTGVQMAYLKAWAPRAHKPLELRLPELLPRAAAGKGEATQGDALDVVDRLEGDVAYLDPPYNQHSYLGNYHVWETLTLWDAPEVYGTACKRVDCRSRPSAFNRRTLYADAWRDLIARVRAPCLVVSFNDEGYIGRATMEEVLATRGHVSVLEHDYPRYVGAKIGIHDPRGRKVGRVGRTRNKEFIYCVGPEPLDESVARA